MTDTFSKNQLSAFLQSAQSLKLYRRAELTDEDTGKNLVKKFYVDPLPNDHVLQTVLKKNTTFLIGRKGTGKSTIFQRVKEELKNKSLFVTAYLDIKTIYES